MNGGMIGAIVGGIVGVMGGMAGTAASIINTKGPHERAVAVRFAILGWLWLGGAMVAFVFLRSSPWVQLAPLVGLPILFAIPRANRRLARARLEDESAGR